MKPLVLVLILFSFGVSAQVNLVTNPSFEEVNQCPSTNANITDCANWLNFGNTPDFFHTCAFFSGIIPPSLDFGYQNPRSGNGMAGIISYVWEQDPGWPNYREYLATQLSDQLVIGEKYFISFFINCAGYFPEKQHIGANKIGARFSTFEYDETQSTIPDNFSNIHTDSIITDTVQWYKVTGSFIADSAYQYLIIGNFYDYIQTDTIIFGGDPFGGSAAYYYIDDICVTTDSLYNETWAGLGMNPLNEININYYPNPASETLIIQSDYPFASLEVINSLGQSVLSFDKLYTNSFIMPLNNLKSGNYILKLDLSDQIKYCKFFIH